MKKIALIVIVVGAFFISGCTTSACVSTKTSASASAACNCGGETKSVNHCSAYNHNGRCVAW